MRKKGGEEKIKSNGCILSFSMFTYNNDYFGDLRGKFYFGCNVIQESS